MSARSRRNAGTSGVPRMRMAWAGRSAPRASSRSRLEGWQTMRAFHPWSSSHRASPRMRISCPPRPREASVCKISGRVSAVTPCQYKLTAPRPSGCSDIVRGTDPGVADHKPWRAIFRLLERDERIFAVLLAVVMVGGLATLGLVRLRPRYEVQSYEWIVFWFAAY